MKAANRNAIMDCSLERDHLNVLVVETVWLVGLDTDAYSIITTRYGPGESSGQDVNDSKAKTPGKWGGMEWSNPTFDGNCIYVLFKYNFS